MPRTARPHSYAERRQPRRRPAAPTNRPLPSNTREVCSGIGVAPLEAENEKVTPELLPVLLRTRRSSPASIPVNFSFTYISTAFDNDLWLCRTHESAKLEQNNCRMKPFR